MGFCLKDYFQTAGGLAINATDNLISVFNKGGGNFDVRCQMGKPFIPFCAIIQGTSTALIQDTIAHHKTNIQVFLDMYTQFFVASVNARDGLTGNPYAEYIAPYGQNGIDFSQYLVKKVGDPQSNGNANYNAYFNAMQLVYNFWNNADAAWTAAQLQDALYKLMAALNANVYPRLYIPPGSYRFNTGNVFQISWKAWADADTAAGATLVGMKCLELNSIE